MDLGTFLEHVRVVRTQYSCCMLLGVITGIGYTVDDINQILYYLKGPKTMGITVYSLQWVMQDLDHQP